MKLRNSATGVVVTVGEDTPMGSEWEPADKPAPTAPKAKPVPKASK